MTKTTIRTILGATLLILSSYHAFSQIFEDKTFVNSFDVKGQNRGVAIGDYNGDGLDDIYISTMSGKNMLYRNLGGFQFEEVAGDMGVADPRQSSCALWFDMDNDRDLDLFIANLFQSNALLRNDGDRFTNISGLYNIGTGGNPRSIHAVDYDNDGDMDVYIANMLEQNILWRNESGQAFTDVTAEAGIFDEGRSLGAIFFDYDLDGDQDLYQTRDGIDPNLFYRNNGDGTFTEISSETGLDYVGFGMGTDVADLTKDGYPDIYLTNLEENLLYLSRPSGVFEEVSANAKVDDIGMGWSTFFFDCNNDGRQDLYVANDSYFGVNGQNNIPSVLYINKGDLTFYKQPISGGVQNTYGSYGAATADFDLDGKIDMAIANNGQKDGNQLFRNTSQTRSYIGFELQGRASNSFGIGSYLTLYANGTQQMDFVTAGSGYASQNSHKVHFGLGDATEIDSVVINWPSGTRQVLPSLPINQVHLIEEHAIYVPQGEVIWTEPANPTQFDDVTIYFNAQKGDGGLAGFTGEVYAHTGVITSQSGNSGDWKYVIADWGTSDPRIRYDRIEDDLYSLSFNITQYFGIQAGDQVEKLAFVFRNANGSVTGRETGGADIFADISPTGDDLQVAFSQPTANKIVFEGASLNVDVQASKNARIIVWNNDEEIYNDSLQNASFSFSPDEVGTNMLKVEARSGGQTVSKETSYSVWASSNVVQDPPEGTRPGLNYLEDSYIFMLHAPGKLNATLLTPMNNFTPNADYVMNESTDGETYWIEIPKMAFGEGEHTYQYMVNLSTTVADPYSEVVLDPANDPFIQSSSFEGLPPYPKGASGVVTAFDGEKLSYDWQVNDFVPAEKADMVIYELLIRDFLEDHSYASLTDSLDYLQKLGVNTIELMPIYEFEGNISWGYNPSFQLAVDKYYGSRDELKAFIDAAHARGMGVILDVVFNHVFSQSPLAQLYWDNANFRPADANPWLNVTPRHPFNVGYDVNHEYEGTKVWVKRNLEQWIEEYRFDGFRFDLSKGLTQTNSGNDAGLMSQRDPSRIAILKDYADYIWSLDPDSYVIMEHFADNNEETELANYGMMLWGNMNHEFTEAAMGYSSDLEWADYRVRGWNDPHLIAYMESHDEERMVNRILQFGDDADGYNTREFETALRRVEAATSIFYSVPGPKMLWQFGELGYEFSINYCPNGSINNSCRVDPKPIRWDYLENESRMRLRNIMASMIYLKTNFPTFSTTDYTFSDANFFIKAVYLNHPDMDAVTLANFRVTESNFNPKFPYTGAWYEFFSGDSIVVTDVNERVTFAPGEYRVYTSKPIEKPSNLTVGIEAQLELEAISTYPNPVSAGGTITVEYAEVVAPSAISLYAMDGRKISLEGIRKGNLLHISIPKEVASGIYGLRVEAGIKGFVSKVQVE